MTKDQLPHVTIEESQLVLAAVAALQSDAGQLTLRAVAERRRLFGFDAALRRFKRD